MITIETNNPETTFTLNTVNSVGYKLRYNLENYLDLYRFFITDNLNHIISYYKNSDIDPDYQSFDFLKRLLQQSETLESLIRINRTTFTRMDEWNLIEFLDEIKVKLHSIENSDKWLRSSKTKNTWRGATLQTDYVLEDMQTLENVSAGVNGEQNSQDDWVRIAVENDISEFDYGTENNKKINITKKVLSNPNYFLFSVVDNLTNEKLYGKDFDRKISFVDDDLKVLSYEQTIKQAVHILMTLKKGDIPEYTTLGVDAKVCIGSNIGSVLFSSIKRQLQETFRTDDSIRNFTIVDISYENGDLNIKFTVDTMYNLTYGSKVKI